MTDAGENRVDYRGGLQPGGRQPAPGRLGLVQAFANTHYDFEGGSGADLLADPDVFREWACRRGLLAAETRVTEGDVSRARAVRGGLRALLNANNGGVCEETELQALNRTAQRARLSAHFAPDGIDLRMAVRGVDGALAAVLAVVAEATLDGRWPRLKACREDDCRWAFYDHSRNAAGSWCSMRVCGGRAKQRAYYTRIRQ